MGVQFKDILIIKEIEIKDLQHKVLVVDAYNMLYQFLSSIRSTDGSLLTDSKGNVTSHLVGLFSRTTNLMQKNLKLAFVFDGKPPELKQEERERRKTLKIEAKKEYEIAKQREDIEGMKKYAGRTSVLTKEMVEEAKKLLNALGLPVIQAPSEGEAQCAFIVKNNDAFAVVSQDFDSLLHGAPKLVRNLSIAGKRKKQGKLGFITVKPELIDLSENLNNLGIDNDKLIAMAMLVGTDYNISGVKGIGPKNALKLVKQFNQFGQLFENVKWKEHFDFDWEEVFYTIKKAKTTKNYKIKFGDVNSDKVVNLLCNKHDFNRERVENTLKKLLEEKKAGQQKGLGDFF